MRFLIILLFYLFSLSLKAENINKCLDNIDRYETSRCLEQLKHKLLNNTFTINLHDLNNTLYTNKNIYLNICNINSLQYRKTGSNGEIIINLTSTEIKNCRMKIEINIKSELGKCDKGKPAIANWNSLDMKNDIYFKCS